MPVARSQQISLSSTPYYHCISRCVRRAFLCGEDSISGNSYEHRRGWVEDRLLLLASVFGIDVCAYAVMSNHLHVVLHVNEKAALDWSTEEVLRRWHQLHKGTSFTQKYLRNEALSEVELALAESKAAAYRQRLMDISWFMKELNEPIAREANIEDGCTGHFWEGRFKSQALLTESALLACMAYVDLNPIRAKMEDTPETSQHTSIKKRIDFAKANTEQPACLHPFIGYEKEECNVVGLAFQLTDYLELVDLTGRVIREDKRGNIDLSLAPILQRIGLTSEQWIIASTQFNSQFGIAAGSEKEITQFCQATQRKRRPKLNACQKLLA